MDPPGTGGEPSRSEGGLTCAKMEEFSDVLLLGFKELIIHGTVKYKEYLHFDFLPSSVCLMYSGKDDPPPHLHPENNLIVTLKVYHYALLHPGPMYQCLPKKDAASALHC